MVLCVGWVKFDSSILIPESYRPKHSVFLSTSLAETDWSNKSTGYIEIQSNGTINAVKYDSSGELAFGYDFYGLGFNGVWIV